MSDLYDTDILEWSEEQAKLLRRIQLGEPVNDQVDWENVIEEIESVGRGEVRAVLSSIQKILRHRIDLLGWPNAQPVRKWRSELRTFSRELRSDYTPRMTGTGKVTDESVRQIYADAVEYCRAHMEADPELPIPPECPWTLDDLLAEAKAALPNDRSSHA